MPRRKTQRDGSPPDPRAKPTEYDVRVSNGGVFGQDHSLPSVDLAWKGGGARGGYLDIHFDGRDFSGITTSTFMDQEEGHIYIRVCANTDPIPEDWQGDDPLDVAGG